MKLNLPNTLTVFRMIMIPVFVVLYLVDFTGHRAAAMAAYFIACVTDFFDGYIARKDNLVTNLGKFLDPIADKMIVAVTLIALSVTVPVVGGHPDAFQRTIAVCTMIIIVRELMVSVFRTVAAEKGVVLAADMIGKVKTVVQMMALFALIPVEDFYGWNTLAGEVFFYGGFALLSLATVLTVVSGAHYFIKNKTVLEDD